MKNKKAHFIYKNWEGSEEVKFLIETPTSTTKC